MNEEELKAKLEDMLKLDYIEIGNSKTGKFKVYVNLNDVEETEQKLEIATQLTHKYNKLINMEMR